MDDHVCEAQVPGEGKCRKSKQIPCKKSREMILFTCGVCQTKFKTICVLHNHLFDHKEGGSYSFDHITKTAFPKYDSISAYAQVGDDLLSLVDHRNDSHLISSDSTDIDQESRTFVKQNDSIRCVRQSSRIADNNITYATGKQSSRCADNNKNLSNKLKKNNGGKEETNMSSIRERNEQDYSSSMSEISIANSELVQNQAISKKKKKNISVIKGNKIPKVTLTSNKRNDGELTCDKGSVTMLSEVDISPENDPELSNQQPDEITASEALIAISETSDSHKTRSSKSKNKKRKTSTGGTDLAENVNKVAHSNHSTELKVYTAERSKVNCQDNESVDTGDYIEKVDSQPQSKATCPTCGKVGSRAMVSYHRYLHKENKELSCDKCGKTFQHPSCLKLHMKVHNDKLFKCPLCPSEFHRKKYLETHMCIHSGEKPYMCELCGKSYRDAMHLKRHIRHVHEKVRKFECDICKEKFFRSDHLKCHRQRHFEAGLKCKYCPRKFKLPTDLERHTFRHTGESKWFCHLCHNGFKYSLPYYKHMLKTHKVEREEASMFRKLLIEKEKQKKCVTSSIQPADMKDQYTVRNHPKTIAGTTQLGECLDVSSIPVSGVNVGNILEVKRYTSTIGKTYKRDKLKKRRPTTVDINCSDEDVLNTDESEPFATGCSEKAGTIQQPLEIFYAQNSLAKTDPMYRLLDKQFFTTSIGNTDNSGIVSTELDVDTNIQIVTMETVTGDLGMMPEFDGEDLQAVMIIDDNDCTNEVIIDQVSTL